MRNEWYFDECIAKKHVAARISFTFELELESRPNLDDGVGYIMARL
jgi:hypothetical protein